MQTPARLLRVHMDNRSHRPPLTDKQREREERILAATQTLMATFSRDALTMGKLAIALRMGTGTIRRHFADIDSILAEILLRHLTAVAKAIGHIPREDPNRRPAQRAAYIEATRTGWGGLSEPHLLLIRERHTLPDDLAKPVEDMRQLIGEALAGENAAIALALLDTPELAAPQIEAMLATTDPKDTAPATKPAQPQPQAQATHKPPYRNWKLPKRYKTSRAHEARAGPAISG